MFRGRQLHREIATRVQLEHDRETHRSTYRLDIDPADLLKRYDSYDIDEAIRISDRTALPFIIRCGVCVWIVPVVLFLCGARFGAGMAMLAGLGLLRRRVPAGDGLARSLTAQYLAELKAVVRWKKPARAAGRSIPVAAPAWQAAAQNRRSLQIDAQSAQCKVPTRWW